MANIDDLNEVLNKKYTWAPYGRAGSTGIPTVTSAAVLGSTTVDPKSKGIEIYKDPKNLPTALASILNHVQQQANFHPYKQDAKAIGHFYPGLEVVIKDLKIFGKPYCDQFKNNFSTKDYNQLLNQVISIFHGLPIRDLNLLKQKLANMGLSVFNVKESITRTMNFNMMMIDLKQPSKPYLILFHANFVMSKTKSGKSDVAQQRYSINRSIYPINVSLIQQYAEALTSLDETSVETWINSASTPSSQGFRSGLCFRVEPITEAQLQEYTKDHQQNYASIKQ